MIRTLFIILIITAISGPVYAQVIRVMSYNIHVGQNSDNQDRLAEIGRLIKESGAELVGLQEVDSMCNRTGQVDQMKVLAEITGMNYAYVRHFAFDGGSYGLGVLSKYHIINFQDLRVGITTDGKPESRAFLKAEINYKGDRMFLLNVHFDYRSSTSRLKQSDEVLELVKKLDNEALILTGDLNAEPASPEILKLNGVLQDNGAPTGLTFPATNPKARIDYIFSSSAFFRRAPGDALLPQPFSDHLPVIANLELLRN